MVGVAWHDDVDVVLEIAFATDPLETPTYTDVSQYVRQLSFERGRGDEFDDFDAGTLSVTLNNPNRLFDPEYSAGTYYGDLIPGKRIRLSYVYGGGTYYRFVGYIDSYTQVYNVADNCAEVQIEAYDGFAMLAQMNLPPDYFGDTIKAGTTPYAWYRLDEKTHYINYDQSGNGRHKLHFNDVKSKSVDSILPFANGSAINYDGNFLSTAAWLTTGTSWSAEAWFLVETEPVANGMILDLRNKVLSGPTVYVAGANDKVYAYHKTSVTPLVSERPITPNEPHQVVVTSDGATFSLYLDGVLQQTQSDSVATVYPYAIERIGNSLSNTNWFDGIIDEVVIYNSCLSAATILEHYNAATDPLGVSLSGDRADATLDLVGWLAADRDIEAGRTAVPPTRFPHTALDYLRDLAKAEQAQMFMSDEGQLVFRNRDWQYRNSRATTSVCTYGDSGSEYRYTDIQVDYSRTYVRNKCTVESLTGAMVEYKDQASIDANGERSEEFQDSLLNTAQAMALANYRVDRLKDPVTRVTSMTVAPSRFIGLGSFAHTLAREIGDRITVKRRPQGVGDAIELDCWIQGISETMSYDKSWSLTFNLSPAEASGYWQLSTSELGSTTILGPF